MSRGQYPIKTTYYHGKQLVKINPARHANSAVERCVGHMQISHYNATVAEVFDGASGVLHAVITRTVKGMNIVFKRVITEGL